jgi:hypothetical protein
MASVTRYTSRYRDDAERWRKRADGPPGEPDVTPEQWREICLAWADGYDDMARKHEAAIAAGREAEYAFWANGRIDR